MLKEMAGNGFHLNIVGALGMFALANVVPRDLVDGQIPGAIERGLEGEDEDGDEPGEPSGGAGSEPQWRRAKAFSQCRRD